MIASLKPRSRLEIYPVSSAPRRLNAALAVHPGYANEQAPVMTGSRSPVATKNQHWVPQFYLRQFATPDSIAARTPKVWLWDKTTQCPLPSPVSVRNVCGQRYLYSPEDKSGARDPTVERVLGEVEDTASRIWPLLVEGELDLTDSEIKKFAARFISILHLRNVFLYRTIDKAMELRDKLYGAPKPEFLASRKETDPDPTHAGRFFVHTMFDKMNKFTDHLLEKPWMVLGMQDAEILTGDRPVIFTFKSRSLVDSELLFPLSPKHILATHGFGTQPKKYVASCPSTIATTTNLMVKSQALRFIVSPKPIL